MIAKRSSDPIPRRARAAVDDFRASIHERKLDIGHAYPHRLQNRQVLIDDMAGRQVAFRSLCRTGALLVRAKRRRKSDHSRCAGQAGEHRGFQQSLQIDRDIVTAPAGDAAQPRRRSRHRLSSLRHAYRSTGTSSSKSSWRTSTSQSIFACGCARRIAAAAGMAWMMSPSEPSRTMRIFKNS